ncbi:MAG: substrate-binding domain-containing protein [Thermodesulfovibrionales bacterium]|jgi:ABC-type molybdate transport system substrate-binding protein|nr:substrate-binding domain-containing protein [Thermodesulfovibrionales bacterium]
MPDRSTGEIELTVPPVDNVLDLHGDPLRADLVIFLNGNQWMVMDELLAAFYQEHPEVKHIFYETIPPGILLQQIHYGAIKMGELVISVSPDIYTAGREEMEELLRNGFIKEYFHYAENELAIMVPSGNPKGIKGLVDLARPDIRICMPNPQTEGVGRLIVRALEKAGGQGLVKTVMEKKVDNGTTYITRIHHRETIYRILNGESDVGPLWISEALYQKRIGSSLDYVTIHEEHNQKGRYFIAIVEKTVKHRATAEAFVRFMLSKKAGDIYASYGFSSGLDFLA